MWRASNGKCDLAPEGEFTTPGPRKGSLVPGQKDLVPRDRPHRALQGKNRLHSTGDGLQTLHWGHWAQPNLLSGAELWNEGVTLLVSSSCHP